MGVAYKSYLTLGLRHAQAAEDEAQTRSFVLEPPPEGLEVAAEASARATSPPLSAGRRSFLHESRGLRELKVLAVIETNALPCEVFNPSVRVVDVQGSWRHVRGVGRVRKDEWKVEREECEGR